MKWMFALLVLANVGLYLWASGVDRADPAQRRINRPTVNEKSMLLLTEIEGDRTPSTQARGECVRIGPFETDEGFNRAAERLDELQLTYNGQTVNARQLQAFRVVLGPYESEAKLEEQLSWLKSKDIDGYRIPEPATAGAISLGLFTQRVTADAYGSELSQEGVAPEVRTEVRTLGPLRWFKVPDLSPSLVARGPPASSPRFTLMESGSGPTGTLGKVSISACIIAGRVSEA